MPRLIHSNPSYRHHKASGRAVVTIDGKDHYLGPWRSKASRVEYDRIIGEWLANGRRMPTSGTPDLLLCELMNAYRKHADTYYEVQEGKSHGEPDAIRAMMKVLKSLYAMTPVRDFGPLALKAVREEMIKLGWARTYCNQQAGRVKRMFKWGVENELVPASIFHALQAVPGLRRGKTDARESEPVKPVPDALVDPILSHVSRQVKAMIELQRITGMRPGEVCAMRGCDVETTGRLWVYRPHSHKTQNCGHARAVYLGPRAKEIVEQFWKPDLQAHLFSPADAEAERRAKLSAARKTPLSCGNRPGTNRKRRPGRAPGTCYTVDSYRRAIADACDSAFAPPPPLARQEKQSKAEWCARLTDEQRQALRQWRIEHRWHPHQLRHTAATNLRKQYGLEAAQVILGHQTLTVTQVYAEKNIEAAMRVMSEVG